MINFEVIDNLFQVAVLIIGVIFTTVSAIRYRDKVFVVLGFAFASFAMGTLFWVLYLAFQGDVPQIFFVPEISWLASWLFCLSMQLVRLEKIKIRFCPVSLVCSMVVMTVALWLRVFGPAYLVSAAFTITIGITVYVTVYRLRQHTSFWLVDGILLACVTWQILLYLASAFMKDYTRFNLYFAVDMLLTLSFISLLPAQVWEVKKR